MRQHVIFRHGNRESSDGLDVKVAAELVYPSQDLESRVVMQLGFIFEFPVKNTEMNQPHFEK
jgi:hypothetical protein